MTATISSGGFADAPGGADNPLLDHLGIRLVEARTGRAVFEMKVQPRHLNRQRSLQGGVVATLLDAAGGYAGLAADGGAVGHAVTVTLTISYLAKVRGGRLRAIGEVTKAGRSLYFADAELIGEDGECIATAQGAFKRSRPSQEL